jgi:hypothetical protein
MGWVSQGGHYNYLSPEEVQEVHHRVIGAAPRAFDRPLPYADYFERPAGSLVMVLDGMEQAKTPFLDNLHKGGYRGVVLGYVPRSKGPRKFSFFRI